MRDFVPDPFKVTLVNLPATVEYLSNETTSDAVRGHFIRNNPLIPGVEFVHGVLRNPDNIIKESYVYTDMLNDISKFKRFSACLKDEARFATVKLDGIGSPAALMTAYNLDLRINGTDIECPSDDDFYTSEHLVHGFVVLGIIGLCGETNSSSYVGPQAPEACYSSYNASWYTVHGAQAELIQLIHFNPA